jgi:hypothetical protein
MFAPRWRLVRTATVIAVLAASVASCGHAIAPVTGGTPSNSATPPVPAPTPTAAPTPARSTPPHASAAAQLAGFFAAAEVADSRLKHAAALVNGGVGKTTLSLSPAALAALKALDTTAAAAAIPAGLPPELLRRTLLVYSDLVSRSIPLGRLWEFRSEYPMPLDSQDGKYLYGCLGNGAPAAARFGADLAAARALAAQTLPVTPPAPDSRPAAELALRIYQIGHRNSGCMECGGYVFTTLSQIVWQPEDEPGVGHSDGYIDGIRFRVTYHAGHGWDVMIWAC